MLRIYNFSNLQQKCEGTVCVKVKNEGEESDLQLYRYPNDRSKLYKVRILKTMNKGSKNAHNFKNLEAFQILKESSAS